VRIGKTRNCVETRRPKGRVFSPHTISSFPNFHECWYNYISKRKKCFIFFYNFAQRNIKKEIFHVDIELCQHSA
jgi:hypothetical protein